MTDHFLTFPNPKIQYIFKQILFLYNILLAKVDRQSASLYSLLNKSRQIDDRNRLLQAALDEHKQKASAASSQLVSSEAQHKQEVVFSFRVLSYSYSLNRPLSINAIYRRKLLRNTRMNSKRALSSSKKAMPPSRRRWTNSRLQDPTPQRYRSCTYTSLTCRRFTLLKLKITLKTKVYN